MSESKGFFDAKKQRIVLIIIIILLLCGFGYNQIKMSDMKRDLNISRQNEYALSGKISETQTKNDKLEYSKGVLVAKSKDLEALSETLAKEVKEEKGKVHRLQRIIATMGNVGKDGKIDTLRMTNTVQKYPDGTYGLKWSDSTYHDSLNFRLLAGESKFKFINLDSTRKEVYPMSTDLTTDVIGFNIITGLKTNKETGMVEIFVRSDYPNFHVTDLEGAIIDPNKDPVIKKFTRKKKFTVNTYLGIGVDRNLGLTPQIGVGIGYNIISF